MNHWTIELKKDADYWEDQVTVKDEAGAPVSFSDAWITIHPDTADPDVVWNTVNGRLRIISDGIFGFEVPLAEIAAYPWQSGKFCWSVTYTDGHVDGSWLVGKVVIREACL